MKYFEVKFTIVCPADSLMQDACDLLAALAGEAGFETFEESEQGLTGYVQQALFERDVLDAALSDFPMSDVVITYDVSEAEDKDWNEEWEQQGFDPITVADGRIIIHDGRHLPPNPSPLTTHPSPLTTHHSPLTTPPSPLTTHHSPSTLNPHPSTLIEIDAKLAFGTGSHETTRMMLESLLASRPFTSVLDCGTGTGILAIAAIKLGADHATGYDIDEWSADNARHNAVINGVDSQFTPLLGDATVLDGMDETFDVVMANINRNILIDDLPRFRRRMHTGSVLLLSGFYNEDIPLLTEKAESLGLRLSAERHEGDWACLKFIC